RRSTGGAAPRADATAPRHQYAYEATTSRLKTVTDRKGQLTTYSYFTHDSLNQKTYTNTSITTPSVSFTYDPSCHRVATMSDGTGTTSYSYYAITAGQLGAGTGPRPVLGQL